MVLVTDAQIGGDLGDGAASGHQIEHLAAELFEVTPGHGHGSFIKHVTESQTNRLQVMRGTSMDRLSGSGYPIRGTKWVSSGRRATRDSPWALTALEMLEAPDHWKILNPS